MLTISENITVSRYYTIFTIIKNLVLHFKQMQDGNFQIYCLHFFTTITEAINTVDK